MIWDTQRGWYIGIQQEELFFLLKIDLFILMLAVTNLLIETYILFFAPQSMWLVPDLFMATYVFPFLY